MSTKGVRSPAGARTRAGSDSLIKGFEGGISQDRRAFMRSAATAAAGGAVVFAPGIRVAHAQSSLSPVNPTLLSVSPASAAPGDVVTFEGFNLGTAPEALCLGQRFFALSVSPGTGTGGSDEATAALQTTDGSPITNIPVGVGNGVALSSGNIDPVAGLDFSSAEGAVIDIPSTNTSPSDVDLTPTAASPGVLAPWSLASGKLEVTLSGNWVGGETINVSLEFRTPCLGGDWCEFRLRGVEVSGAGTAAACAALLATALSNEFAKVCPQITASSAGGTITVEDTLGSVILLSQPTYLQIV